MPRGLQCYDPSQEPAYTQPGTEATPAERPQSLLPRPRGRRLRSQVTAHGLSVTCELHSQQPGGCLDHTPAEGERRQPAEAVGPKPLSQQPASPELCSLSLVCRENTASSLPAGLALTPLSDIRPEGGQGAALSYDVTHSVPGCAFSRIYRGREGQ